MAWFAVRVSGTSMLPTLRPGDLLAARSLRRTEPRTGQIVVASDRGREIVKRVAVRDGDSLILCGDGDASSDAVVDVTAVTGVVRVRYWPAMRLRRFA